VPLDEIPALVLGAPCWRPRRAFWCGVWATKFSTPFVYRVLLPALGVEPVTYWTWIKTSRQGELVRGMGQYGRHGTETLIWAKRGVIGRRDDAWQKALADFPAPVGEHSEKPDFPYEQALKVFEHSQALAMFERKHRPGYLAWGDEAPPAADVGVQHVAAGGLAPLI
jgi:N6-adenosine-specific RNA methylase IME4